MKTLGDTLHETDPQSFPKQDIPAPPADSIGLASKKTGKSFSRAVLESKQYRDSIVARVVAGTLPAAVECKMWDHAFGVPKQRVEVEDKTNPYENMSPEQIQTRIRVLMDTAQRLGASLPVQDDGDSVH
jgi:hypothetical protein